MIVLGTIHNVHRNESVTAYFHMIFVDRVLISDSDKVAASKDKLVYYYSSQIPQVFLHFKYHTYNTL